MRVPEQPRRVLHLGQLLNRPGGPAVYLTGVIFQKQRVAAHALAIWRHGHKEPWLLVSNLNLGERLAELYARRMQVEALFRDAKSGAFEWELSRVVRAERAQRLLLAIMLGILCAVLLGGAAIRAGE